MKKSQFKRLLSSLDQPVVALGSELNRRGDCKAVDKLIRRAKCAFDLQVDDNIVAAPDGRRIHLLAELVSTVELVGYGAPTRWRVVRIVRHGNSEFFAVRVGEWGKYPALPGIDLDKDERELAYQMATTLARTEAFYEHRMDAGQLVQRDARKNALQAQTLGDADERRLLTLLKCNPLALHALEAVVLAGAWSHLPEDKQPNFAVNFVLMKNANHDVLAAFWAHLQAVDLLRAPKAQFGAPIVLEVDAVKDMDALNPLYGRLALIKVATPDIRKQFINKLRANARLHTIGTPRHSAFPAMPLTIGSTAWPGDVAVNFMLNGNILPLGQDEADTLRLAAARMLQDIEWLAKAVCCELHSIVHDPHAYMRNEVDVWLEAVRRTLLRELFEEQTLRDEARSLFINLGAEERAAFRERSRKIEKGIDFLLSPERYADVLLDEKPGDVDVFADATAFRCSADGGRVIAFNKVKLPGLLLRAGVPADLTDEVIDGLKSRGIIKNASTKIRIGKDTPRVLAIPVEKLQSSTVPGVPGDSGEGDSDE